MIVTEFQSFFHSLFIIHYSSFSFIQWNPYLNPVFYGLLLTGSAVCLRLLYLRLLRKTSREKVLRLILPRILIVLLLTLALFDPTWHSETHEPVKGRIMALVDTSFSMDVKDRNHESRMTRARNIVDEMKKNLPRGVTVDSMEFDSAVRSQPVAGRNACVPEPGKRETDLGSCLLALSERSDLSSYLGIIFLTDGGDEPVQCARLPSVPLSIIGIGTDPSSWNDLAIADIQVPVTAEAEVDFEVSADIRAHTGGDPAFASKLDRVTVTLEKESRDGLKQVLARQLNLSNQWARAMFRISEKSSGLQRYRFSVEPINGELSALNNIRRFSVDIHSRSLHVLYFTRKLGMDFKLLRNALARDPGISFTALFRTISEHFTVQGNRLSGDDELQAGFPRNEKTLKLYDCLIIGSVPIENWSREQMQALISYVEQGGTVIFMGGEDSFGQRGYADSPLSSLFPWRIEQSKADVITGRFAVSIPLSASGHPVMEGVDQHLMEETHAAIDSLYYPGPLKVGATCLMNAVSGNQSIGVMAIQPFGTGNVLGIATDTFWKWARQSNTLKIAYRLFWRQAVRNLSRDNRSGRIMRIHWDKDQYKPGEQAKADIYVHAPRLTGTLRLSAMLSITNKTHPLTVESAPGQQDMYTIKMAFKNRGEYNFRLSAYDDQDILETIEKTIVVAPLMGEGANLETDEDFLKKLAEDCSGIYVREDAADTLIQHLTKQYGRTTRVVEQSMIQSHPYYFLAMIMILVLEWIIRRRMNLV